MPKAANGKERTIGALCYFSPIGIYYNISPMSKYVKFHAVQGTAIFGYVSSFILLCDVICRNVGISSLFPIGIILMLYIMIIATLGMLVYKGVPVDFKVNTLELNSDK